MQGSLDSNPKLAPSVKSKQNSKNSRSQSAHNVTNLIADVENEKLDTLLQSGKKNLM